MRRGYCLPLVFALVVPFAAPSFSVAWSKTGHHVVANIAFDRLPIAARQKVIALLRTHPRLARDPHESTRGATRAVAADHIVLGVAGSAEISSPTHRDPAPPAVPRTGRGSKAPEGRFHDEHIAIVFLSTDVLQ